MTTVRYTISATVDADTYGHMHNQDLFNSFRQAVIEQAGIMCRKTNLRTSTQELSKDGGVQSSQELYDEVKWAF